MGFLTGKKVLIAGLISNRSIAYGIAQAMHREGAELAFTYQDEKFKERITEMAGTWGSKMIFPCDVASDGQIDTTFNELSKQWNQLDILVHSIAYAPADQLEGDYLEKVNREGFRIAHDISSYSFAALGKAAAKMMQSNGALLTMTYIGSQRVVPNYNVMGVAKASLEANVRYMANSLGPKGIRVNAISAGPIRTLAASGIKDFRKLLASNEKIVPLRKNVSLEDVGNAAAFLCSDLAGGITGEILYVDGGFHILGLSDIEPTIKNNGQ